ncbi:transposable element Tcb2 transposase [Trichonephila clavipes]|nr:transposable element Tcb2 transposase [Trichonephila clavipes]
MAWLVYSPVLNHIENLWDALGRAVSPRFPPPDTLIELETALLEGWRLLNSAVVDHLIESMVRSSSDSTEPRTDYLDSLYDICRDLETLQMCRIEHIQSVDQSPPAGVVLKFEEWVYASGVGLFT